MTGSPGTVPGAARDPRAELRVLVVEDTASVAELIRRSLEADGMRVEVVTTLGDADARLSHALPDVIVLDVELPDGSGLDLLRGPSAPTVPVVILSSRQEELDRVVGLELGAEDYMIKPFFPRELAARVRLAASRRAEAPPSLPDRLDFGELVIDVAAREVVVSGTLTPLTDREFDVLAHLARSPRKVFHREELLGAVWRSSAEWQTPKTVTEHIRRIRQKIEDDPAQPRRIVTVGRAGYRFEPG